jgi:hypothetical protein
VNGSVGQVIGFNTYNEARSNHKEVPGVEEKENDFVTEYLKSNDQVWPLVRFANNQEVLCVSADFTINNVEGGTEARRTQVKLEIIIPVIS